jgi:hypothetical protein
LSAVFVLPQPSAQDTPRGSARNLPLDGANRHAPPQ